MLFLATLATLAALVAPSSAAEGWSGATVSGGEFGRPRVGGVAVGVGGSWIVGANGGGYRGGLAERLAFDVALGRHRPNAVIGAFTVELDHARHSLTDAGAYFSDASSSATDSTGTTIPPSALTGFRDYIVLDAGFRVGFDVSGTERASVGEVRVLPYVRLGVGVAFSSTLLDAPSFTGRVAMRSRTAWPAPGLSLGAEVLVRRWISVLPHVKTQVQVFEDAAESMGADTRLAAEWRLQPAIDVRVNF